MMTIEKKLNGSTLELNLIGRLDTTTAPQLEDEVKNNTEGVTELIFDFEELAYISSAGLRVLLSSQKLMNKQGTMVIRHASEEVMEIFDITGFSDILNIE